MVFSILAGSGRHPTAMTSPLPSKPTFLPLMERLQVRRVITGWYDSTPDRRPILGSVNGLDGLYLATGFSGHGFMLSPAVGEMMAELMAGSRDDPLLKEFSLERFSSATTKEGLQI